MILKQYYLGCLAHASYLLGDEDSGVGIVVDPQRDVDGYVADAAASGLRIEHVFLTHFHADFVAGHLELRDFTGARIHLGARARAEYAFDPAADGDELTFGRLRLKVLETPGHTPEGISILVFDLARSADRPHAVLTGDTLFIGDVGRPDLMASVGVTAAQLAGQLYDSLHDKLLPLPDETLIYPAHGAGSMCGKNLSSETVSTIGVQRRYNYALQPMSREEFVGLVTADQPEAPGYFSYDAQVNRQERATLDEALRRSLHPLPLDEVLSRQAAGGQVVDVRDSAEFAGAHLRGAINIGLGGKFATWAGTVLDRTKPIVIVGDPGQEEEAAVRLGRIGFDQVAGFLEGEMNALAGRADLLRRVERITAPTLAEALSLVALPPEADRGSLRMPGGSFGAGGSGNDEPLVIDVRNPGEHRERRIEGSVSIPLGKLATRMAEIPRDRPVVLHCASGYRSSIAASLLSRAGYTNQFDLVGGIAAWEAAKLPETVSS